jgi:beta-glucanase (GH16 family)
MAMTAALTQGTAYASPRPSGRPLHSTSNVLFSDYFTGGALGPSWNPYITSAAAHGAPWQSNGRGGSGEGCANDAEYFLPSEIFVNNGLSLQAQQAPTAGVCNGASYVFPWASAAVTTYGHFQFDGGYVDVYMKAPEGDGMWPAIWMLPGQGAPADDFEVDIQEGGFTGASGGPRQAFAWHLHDNSINQTVGGVVGTGVDLGAGFHHYGLSWVPGQSLTWYLDGKQVASVTQSSIPIPNEPMELVLSLGIASPATSGWHSVVDPAAPSPVNMSVASVVVTSNP